MPIQLTDAMLDAAVQTASARGLIPSPEHSSRSFAAANRERIREVVQAALDAMPAVAVPFGDPVHIASVGKVEPPEPIQ